MRVLLRVLRCGLFVGNIMPCEIVCTVFAQEDADSTVDNVEVYLFPKQLATLTFLVRPVLHSLATPDTSTARSTCRVVSEYRPSSFIEW